MNEHQFLLCHLLCRFSRNQSDRRYCSPHAMSSVSKKFKVRGPLLCCIHLIKFESDPYHVIARLESFGYLPKISKNGEPDGYERRMLPVSF